MSVVKKIISLEHIPAVIWGVPSSNVYLYVHGQGGNKEEAADFAEIVCRYGFQTLSIDLPGHGERKDEKHILPEGQSALCGLAFFVFDFSLLKNALHVFI